ncbi:hypothetical protein Prum_024630 [Phytohabitans rumicis]|uniref:Uncharacterized protein n=1 Tax=Phytohabitans rumicis TaxID=1076125 RepID=A0A6V8L1Z2_9ACTN|nr:hypothetical protein Prum_024630 [Phytohabitans rumicis]
MRRRASGRDQTPDALLLEAFLEVDGYLVAFLLADRLADVRLDRQLVRAVAQRHERAPERVTVDRPRILTSPRVPKNSADSGQTTYVQPPLFGLFSSVAVNTLSMEITPLTGYVEAGGAISTSLRRPG